MSAYKTWAAKQRGNPLLLIATVLGFTASFFIAYKNYYQPWSKKRQLSEAESYAALLYKKENEQKES